MVYLDTNFWLLLREGHLQPEKNKLEPKLSDSKKGSDFQDDFFA